MKIKGCLLSMSNEWATPQQLFDQLNQEFNFTLDPCCTKETAKCKKFYTQQEDGLRQSWVGERVFMNPPYGREIGKWMRKAVSSGADLVVALIPSRTDTSYWHDCVEKFAKEVRFIRGRVRFVGATVNNAPFASCIVVF